ncbi:MAG: GC-type dockerin domain-anchored protein [Phycisphaerales bacterium JB060]
MRTPILRAALATLPAAHAAHATPGDCPVVRLSGVEGLAQSFGSVTLNDRHLIAGDGAALSLCPGGDPLGCRAGAIFTFEPFNGGWVARDTIIPPDIEFNDGFGLGATLDSRNPDRFVTLSGRRFLGDRVGQGHVFEFDGEEWREASRFESPAGHPLSTFGFRSALHGDTLLINQSARVHRYRDVAGEFEYQDTLTVPDGMVASPSPAFGRGGMALDDDWAFIGAPMDSTHRTQHGAVAVYRREADGSLTFAQYLLPPAETTGDLPEYFRFGSDLGFDGRTLVVGAPLADRDFESQGVAFVYELEGGVWTMRQELRSSEPGTIPGHFEQFGGGISIEGDTLVVGYAVNNNPLRRTHLFRSAVDGTWREAAILTPGDAAPTPAWGFGYESALHGNTLVVGASKEGTTGAAYVFDLSCILDACPPDLDADGALTVFDFLTFMNLFDAGDADADFDGDGELTIFDFLAFQTAFDAGCA